jgi:hypothetical protein
MPGRGVVGKVWPASLVACAAARGHEIIADALFDILTADKK